VSPADKIKASLDLTLRGKVRYVCQAKQSAGGRHDDSVPPSDDITRGGIVTSSQHVKCNNRLGAKYPRQVALVRIVIGIWLLVLTAILYRSGHVGQWAWLLTAVAIVHFALAYRLFRVARSDVGPRMRFQ